MSLPRLVPLLFLLGATPLQDEQCAEAVDQYNSAIQDVELTLARYRTCLSSTDGTDDCSSEFQRLRNAQSDLEDAVNSYRSDCDK